MAKPRLAGKQRKLAIVQAALPLFARHGFAQTTTKDLARAAGVSEPLLYKHFPSKEALYLEIQAFNCQTADPLAGKLGELPPSTSTLVYLVYYLLRALILGRPAGRIEWETRHRLMLQSILGDGDFARSVLQNRFACFCSLIERSLAAASASGDLVPGPVSKSNRAFFAHHTGAWLAITHLPRDPVLNYKSSSAELLHQAGWFVLRGMGLTDKALARYYRPSELARFFGDGHLRRKERNQRSPRA